MNAHSTAINLRPMVSLLAVTRQSKVILVQEQGIVRGLHRMPCDAIKPGETSDEAMVRVLAEQTGYRAIRNSENTRSIHPNRILMGCPAMCHNFVLTDCYRDETIKQRTDLGLVYKTLDDVRMMANQGQLENLASAFLALDYLGLENPNTSPPSSMRQLVAKARH